MPSFNSEQNMTDNNDIRYLWKKNCMKHKQFLYDSLLSSQRYFKALQIDTTQINKKSQLKDLYITVKSRLN